MANDVLFMEEGKVVGIADSKSRNGVFYRIEVEDVDTGDTAWYGLGSKEPEFGEGSVISFEYEESGKYLNAVADSIEVLDLVEPKSRGNKSNSRSGGRSSGRSNDNAAGSSRGSRSSRANNDSGSNSSEYSGNKGGNSYSNKGSSGTKTKGETNWAEKDLRAGLGFAREQAIKVLAAMIAEDAIKLPSKAADKMDAYLNFLDMLTARFLEQGDNYVNGGITSIYADAEDE